MLTWCRHCVQPIRNYLEPAHPLYDLFALLRWKIIELRQPLPQLFLPLRRKFFEIGVVLECGFLLVRRKVFEFLQPITVVSACALW